MKNYQFKCGCSFPIKKELTNALPLLHFTYDDLNTECDAVWDIFAKGNTLGVFQFDSNLGQKFCKELKPISIEHLSGLSAALRPGTLQSHDEKGKSLTQKYCDRKNRKEPVDVQFPAIQHILEPTYGILLYQEQQIAIAQEVCGFSPGEADSLRRGVGKKLMKVILELEEKFISGAKRVGKITEADAKLIFSWIKEASRYSFNASHSCLYGLKAYKEAYLKYHFPLAFYTSKMGSPRKSKTTEDVANLIYEAKKFNVQTKLPDLRHMMPKFYNDGQSVYFGLVNIKGFGKSSYQELAEVFKNNLNEVCSNFFEFAMNAARYLTPSVVEALINSGSCDFFHISRAQMIEEYRLVGNLTKPQKDLLFKFYDAQKAGVIM